MQQTLEAGRSIYFMVASNPGPGLGLLLAYSLFGKKAAKQTAPGAIIIHFFGGIHEIYFPYVLMKPLTILSMIAGGMTGIITFELFDAGLVAGPSPGSIFSYLALTPRGNFLGVMAGVVTATLVSFFVTSVILKADKSTDEDRNFELSVQKSKMMKSEGRKLLKEENAREICTEKKEMNKISFACDAGMGSSAMGATIFKKKLQKAGITDVEIKNYRIEEVPEDSDLVIVHQDLEERTRKAHPNMKIVTLKNYLQDPVINGLAEEIIGLKTED